MDKKKSIKLAPETDKYERRTTRRSPEVSEIERLSSFGCTILDIAEFYGVTEKLIRDDWGDIIKAARQGFKQLLLQKQMEVALGGNVNMLIHMGKVHLAQNPDVKTDKGINTMPTNVQISIIGQDSAATVMPAVKMLDDTDIVEGEIDVVERKSRVVITPNKVEE